MWTRRHGKDAKALHAEYTRACQAGDARRAERAVRALIELKPDLAWAWFDAGLQSKRRRDWERCADDNRRALALARDETEDPAAWNLGIALTALGDWAGARRAWEAYGIEVADNLLLDEPLTLRMGITPVRLNPDPRHLGETQLQHGVTEVVWSERLCPARARITNVPTPQTGHRYGDVVLHDGEPVGERTWQGQTYAVFNELQLLERSEHPTCSVDVVCDDEQGVTQLLELFHERDLGAEDWGSSLVVLCRACSEGNPDHSAHRHDETEPGGRSIALGADPAQARTVLEAWAGGGSGRTFGEIDVLL